MKRIFKARVHSHCYFGHHVTWVHDDTVLVSNFTSSSKTWWTEFPALSGNFSPPYFYGSKHGFQLTQWNWLRKAKIVFTTRYFSWTWPSLSCSVYQQKISDIQIIGAWLECSPQILRSKQEILACFIDFLDSKSWISCINFYLTFDWTDMTLILHKVAWFYSCVFPYKNNVTVYDTICFHTFVVTKWASTHDW